MARQAHVFCVGVLLVVLPSLVGGCASVQRMSRNMDVMAHNTGVMASNTAHIAGATASADMKTGYMIQLLKQIRKELAEMKKQI